MESIENEMERCIGLVIGDSSERVLVCINVYLCICVVYAFRYFIWLWISGLTQFDGDDQMNEWATACDSILFTVSLSPFILYMTFDDVPHIFYFIFIEFRYTILLIHPTCCSKCWIILNSLGFAFFLLVLCLSFTSSLVLCAYLPWVPSLCLWYSNWPTDYLQVWLTNVYMCDARYGGHTRQRQRVFNCRRWIKRDFYEK